MTLLKTFIVSFLLASPIIIKTLPEPQNAPVSEVIEIIEELDYTALELKIATCESSLNPKAVGVYGELGIFQILPNTAKIHKCEGDLLEESANLMCARKIMNGQGISAWRSSQHCWNHIDSASSTLIHK